MSFKSFERTPVNLSILMMLSFGLVTTGYADDATQVNPASTQACVALESNADRLACYDKIFKTPAVSAQVLVSEQRAAMDIEKAKPEPVTLKEKLGKLLKIYLPFMVIRLTQTHRYWIAVGSCLKTVSWVHGIFVHINLFICFLLSGPARKMNSHIVQIHRIQ